jgi:hypothetical protein
MSIKKSAFVVEKDQIVVQEVREKQRPRSRISVLLLFLGVASALYALLARVAPPLDAPSHRSISSAALDAPLPPYSIPPVCSS